MDYWDRGQAEVPSARFWSPIDPSFIDVHRLLRKHVAPGSALLEFGFAPGKYLASAALKLQARVTGVDYSPKGVRLASEFFRRLGLDGDLRTENLLDTSLPPGSFDTVFSTGLVEHFDDPRPIVAKHLEMARPGGKVILIIPNYGGVYGRMQRRCEPDNLAIHNLGIMSPEALGGLFEPRDVSSVRARPFGRPHLWSVGLSRIMPGLVARLLQRAAGAAGSLARISIPGLAPYLVAVAVKR